MSKVHFLIAINTKEELVSLPPVNFGQTRADQIFEHCAQKRYSFNSVRVIETSNRRIDLSLKAFCLGLR